MFYTGVFWSESESAPYPIIVHLGFGSVRSRLFVLPLSAGLGKNLCVYIRVSGPRFEVGTEAESCGPPL